jgi:hypothetical protein
MSSIRTINEKYKFDKHFKDIDQTQYINRMNSIPLSEFRYEVEENIESDEDKTKENIELCEPNKVPLYTNIVKTMNSRKVK